MVNTGNMGKDWGTEITKPNQNAEYQINKAPTTGPISLQRERQGSENVCQEWQEVFCRTSSRNWMCTVYKITKRLCGNYTNHSAFVIGKNGSTTATEREQDDRWVEHFCEVLNHPQPYEPASLRWPQHRHQTPTEAEVKNAIKTMKNGKAQA